MTFAETVDRVEVLSPPPAEPVSPMCVTTPVVEAPVVMVDHVLLVTVVEFVARAAPAPVAENVAPTPFVTYTAPAPLVGYITPSPAPVVAVPPVVEEEVQPAPVDELYVPAPAVSYAALAPVVEDIDPTPAVTYVAEQASVVDCIAPAPCPAHRWLLWLKTLLLRPPCSMLLKLMLTCALLQRLP